MSRSNKRFTAFIATILSFALVLGAIPVIPWIAARAEESTVWFVPDKTHQIIHSDEATSWWGSAWGYKTAYLGNGLHFETKFPGTAVRTGYTQTFALDGLIFAFANVTNEQSKAVITMLLSASTYFTLDPTFSSENNTLDVALDTVNGRIVLEDGTVLLENEALRYANLTGKTFTVAFRKDSDGYRVAVDVDGTSIAGTAVLTSAMIAACSDIRDEDHIVIGVAGGAGSEGLTGFDLRRVGGAKKASVKGGGTLTVADLAIPAANNFWPDRLALQDAPTGGVRMLFYNQAITNVRNGTYASAKMDGLYLKVNNISAIRANSPNNLPEIAFVFTSNDAYTSWAAANQMVALVLDTRNGKLRYSADSKFLEETHVILSDEALKYNNIAQREVVLRLFKNNNGAYKVQVEIDGKEPLIGSLPASYVESSPFLSDPDQAKLVITPAIPEGAGMPGMAEFMVDVVEYFATAEGESGKTEDTDPDIEPIDGVTYLDTSKLKIYGSDNSEIIGTKQAWAQSGGLIVTNLKAGVRMAFRNAVAVGHREGYAEKLALDRTELTFRRLQGGDFGLVFGNQDNIYPIAFGANTLMLAYSASGQKLYVRLNDGTTVDVITGLAPQVLGNNLFTYYFEADAQGGYTLRVTAGETVYTGTIPAQIIAASGISDFGAVEMSVNPVTTGDSFTVDFIGVRRIEDTDPDIEPIDGVTYLDTSKLKIHSNPNQHEQSTLKAWKDAGFMTVTELKKGVRFNFNTTEANVREGYKETMNLKGMQLHFRRFRGTGFGITIADTGSSYPPQFGAGTRSLAIRYDAAQKRIYAVTLSETGAATETDLIRNITLPGNAYFTYTFAINAQRGYDFTVTMDNTVSYTGIIAKEILDQAKAITNVGKIEVSVNSGGFSETQIDYIGVRQLTLVDVAAVADVMQMIDAIGTVSLENGTPIRSARKAYELLNQEEKEAVTNYGILRKAEEDYRDLAVKADLALTYLTIADSRHTGSTSEAIQKTVQIDWANNMHASNIATGGLHLDFTGAVNGHREGYSKKVDMTDLLMQFDNLDASYAENARFAVLLGKDAGFYGIQYDPDNPPLALVLDPAAGTLTAYPRGHILIQSDYLKLENLMGKRFAYILSSNGENAGYTLTVRIAGQELKGTLSEEDISAANLLSNTAACSVMICPWTTETAATCTFSLDFLGVCQTALLKRVEQVKALIAALPSIITRNDVEAVNEALVRYRALARSLRTMVDNRDRLDKALAQMYELLKEDTSWSDGTVSDGNGEPEETESPKTGETVRYIWPLLSVLCLIVLAGSWEMQKKRPKAGESLHEGGTKSC